MIHVGGRTAQFPPLVQRRPSAEASMTDVGGIDD
jgi:hypothetical protein